MDDKKFIAIDIGGSATKYAVLDLKLNKYDFGKVTSHANDIDKLYKEMKDLITSLQAKFNIKAIGISSPGGVDPRTKYIYGASALPCIHENDWVLRLEKETGLEIAINNDSNCASLAEVMFGNASEYNNVLCTVIGTGVGGTLIVDKNVLVGSHYQCGEFGFMASRSGDKLRSVSATCSTAALVSRVNKQVSVQNGLEVFKLLDQGNEIVINEVKDYAYDLALFYFNLVHAFDPDIVLVGGAISARLDLIQMIRDQYKAIQSKYDIDTIDLNLDVCKFGNDSNLFGAIGVYL